ncbi:dethiobiotin synthase [Myroides guanonis]|uniref:ATP-dependent dethiobiotin synthetase BioD n=1 Tax=Myroides guanonis TaxID=1150112 RepID=A0A1I3KW88_9FLAO|nr:dethiobiotin synthase [Myroides guanonis]SFI76717.1 dethiobiotin synthetase [Myroides guanonis]
MKLFVTGVGTGVGKTVVSSILVSKFKADYWKPIQAGDLEDTDSMKVYRWTNNIFRIHKERYAFQRAASPHEAAAVEGIEIKLNDFEMPQIDNNLIVEGAGGLFVPLNDKEYMIDLIVHLQLEVILVIRDYLGVINHSLLSIKALELRGISIYSVVFNGEFNPYTVRAIKGALPQDMNYIYIDELIEENGYLKNI